MNFLKSACFNTYIVTHPILNTKHQILNMNYWLVKTEPDTYSWSNLVKDGSTSWDGVRNYAARIHLKAMKKGDTVLIYHSGGESSVVGTATVQKEFYQDPTTKDEAWVSVMLKAEKQLKKPVTLAQVKADKRLKNMPLVKIGRLSVQPVTKEEFDAIVAMGS
jgi:predicted RNA-binding protein with PUA-like domain